MKQLLWISFMVGLIAVAGCGKQATRYDSPTSLAKAFVQQMDQGDFAAAAKLFAIEMKCKQDATDWNTYAPNQRMEIVQKMTKRKADELGRMGYTPGAYTVGGVQQVQQGQYVLLNGTHGNLGLLVVATDKGYKIYSLSPE